MLLVDIVNKLIMFMVVFVVSLMIIIIYNMASTKHASSGVIYNYDPLPTVHPTDLPDTGMKSRDIPACLMTPTECSPNGECAECADNGNITCSDPSSDVVYELPSGVQIPNDNKSYCIPKAATNQPCNRYTGRYVWTDSAETGGQEWKCECLYPDLFNNPQSGCTDQVACTRPDTDSHQSPVYKLADVESLKAGQPAKFWDPKDPNADLSESPYTMLEDDTAKYVCACGVQTDEDGNYVIDRETVPPHVRLPNDPYNCHLDTCDELQGYLTGVMVDQKTGLPGCTDGDCSCTGNIADSFWCDNNANTFKIKLGKYKNKCYDTGASCKEVKGDTASQMTEDSDGMCDCKGGKFSRMCVSENVSIDDIKETYPGDWHDRVDFCSSDSDCVQGTCDTSSTLRFRKNGKNVKENGVCRCQDSQNPIGTECVSACYPHNPCQNNTQCIIDESNSNSYRNFTCDCETTADGKTKKFNVDENGVDDRNKQEETTHVFKTDNIKDCNGNPVYTYWGNSYKHPKGVCTDLLAVGGTKIYQNKRTCVLGIAYPKYDDRALCTISKNGIEGASDDIPWDEYTDGIGAGVDCEKREVYTEGSCNSQGWKNMWSGTITSSATCGQV